jgi:hypothetical protein
MGLGDDDQLGNLNELSPELTLKALSRVEEGKVYDLGLAYDRRSYKFEGHNYGEIISFRTPDGLNTQKDIDFVTSEEDNSLNTTWASNALFISDNVSTQIDSFGHIYEGSPPHAYNGFRSEEIQGDFGLLKLGADTIPPIIAPATMIDVAGSVGEDPLPESFGIGPDRLQEALDKQGVDIDPLDVVLVRTGTACGSTATAWAQTTTRWPRPTRLDSPSREPSGSSRRRALWPSGPTPPP